jgi:hypothetical protein
MCSAQDTIYKRSGDKINGKVLEVNINEVSYKRADLPDGPTIISSKKEIAKIIYSSGQVDSFKVTASGLPVRMIVSSNKLTVHPDNIALTPRRGVYVYHKQNFSDTRLVPVVQSINHPIVNREIDLHAQDQRKSRKMQYTIGFGGAGVSLACLAGSMIMVSDLDGNDGALVLLSMATASAGVSVFVVSQIFSVSYKLKRVKHANSVMELHNQSLN